MSGLVLRLPLSVLQSNRLGGRDSPPSESRSNVMVEQETMKRSEAGGDVAPLATVAAIPSVVERAKVTGRVALIQSPALGDSLLLTIIAHNLQRNGMPVTVFGRQGQFLADWFPHIAIAPALTRETLTAALADFDTVIQLHRDHPFDRLHEHHPNVVLLSHIPNAPVEDAMAHRLAAYCRTDLQLQDVTTSNGLTPLPGLQHRRHRMRVAIHPTASTGEKQWLPSRFIALGLALREAGFDPQYVMTTDERSAWGEIEAAGMAMPAFASLSDVAAWLYESGWFIGNDSGIGHLASNLQIPTLSLFMRKGSARTWRPSWGIGKVLIGGTYIPTGKLKERYWKHALTVRRVMRAFAELRQTGERHTPGTEQP